MKRLTSRRYWRRYWRRIVSSALGYARDAVLVLAFLAGLAILIVVTITLRAAAASQDRPMR